MIFKSGVWFGALLFICAHIVSWFQLNIQFINDWWKGKALLSVIVFGIPCGLLFWYGWRMTTDSMGKSLWAARFLSFGLSYLTFPILTHYFMGESMFTSKTLICVFLSVMIIFVQIYS
jgi:hypothetical protein